MEAERAGLGLGNVQLTFGLYAGEDFTDQQSPRHITTGASVYLYRAAPNPTHRTPPGRLLTDGRRERPQLPLDLHILVTLWGAEPDTQNRLVGWIMRTLEDHQVLPATVLNLGRNARVFEDDETVELVLGDMPGEEMLELWDQISSGELFYRISLPYVARNVYIQSSQPLPSAADVQVRGLDMQRSGEPR